MVDKACDMSKVSEFFIENAWNLHLIGDRTFPAAAASVWNSLPESVRASPSLQVFRSRLKTKLFARSCCSD